MTQHASKPAKRNHKDKIAKVMKRQSWLLFICVLIILLLDMLVLKSQLVWAKSFVSGAVLSFTSQYALAWFSFRYTGYQARRHIVTQLYLGEACRWFINIFGFVMIFSTIRPLEGFAVLLGFIMIQLSYIIILWRLN